MAIATVLTYTETVYIIHMFTISSICRRDVHQEAAFSHCVCRCQAHLPK